MTASFQDLGLSDKLLQAIQSAGYEKPTQIQEKAVPQILMGRDIIASAQTGTGKTASFVLPMLDILDNGQPKARMPRSLILEPTRELAAQVAENFEIYGQNHKLNMALLIGGVSFSDQVKILERGVDVLVATPGRLIDHIERGGILLNDVKMLVIDESDRMLDMGFIPDIEKLTTLLPAGRQTVMFSATMPPEIRKLSEKFMSNPKQIQTAPPSTASHMVKQSFISCRDGNAKTEKLIGLLKDDAIDHALIFLNRKRDVAQLAKKLISEGFGAGELHGDMDQHQRLETLKKFRNGEICILACSDVAARGLDIPEVSHVFNYDVPTQAEDYVHRIGRTGRAGRAGIAIMLATRAEEKYVHAIEGVINDKILPAEGKKPKVKEKTSNQDEPAPQTQKTQQSNKSSSRRPSSGRPAEKAANASSPKDIEPEKELPKIDIDDAKDKAFGQTNHVPAFLR